MTAPPLEPPTFILPTPQNTTHHPRQDSPRFARRPPTKPLPTHSHHPRPISPSRAPDPTPHHSPYPLHVRQTPPPTTPLTPSRAPDPTPHHSPYPFTRARPPPTTTPLTPSLAQDPPLVGSEMPPAPNEERTTGRRRPQPGVSPPRESPNEATTRRANPPPPRQLTTETEGDLAGLGPSAAPCAVPRRRRPLPPTHLHPRIRTPCHVNPNRLNTPQVHQTNRPRRRKCSPRSPSERTCQAAHGPPAASAARHAISQASCGTFSSGSSGSPNYTRHRSSPRARPCRRQPPHLADPRVEVRRPNRPRHDVGAERAHLMIPDRPPGSRLVRGGIRERVVHDLVAVAGRLQ